MKELARLFDSGFGSSRLSHKGSLIKCKNYTSSCALRNRSMLISVDNNNCYDTDNEWNMAKRGTYS